MIKLFIFTILVAVIFSCYSLGLAWVFSFYFSNYWEALSYTLSLISTNGEGYLYCPDEDSQCRLATVYLGGIGIVLGKTLIVLVALLLCKLWLSVCDRRVSNGSCCGLTFKVMTLVTMWFFLFVLLPSVTLWALEPEWANNNESEINEGEEKNFMSYHYTVFVTVSTVGFGDDLIAPLRYESVAYLIAMLSSAFLGSIFAFVVHVLYGYGEQEQLSVGESE